jgi:hypothetical protein
MSATEDRQQQASRHAKCSLRDIGSDWLKLVDVTDVAAIGQARFQLLQDWPVTCYRFTAAANNAAVPVLTGRFTL